MPSPDRPFAFWLGLLMAVLVTCALAFLGLLYAFARV